MIREKMIQKDVGSGKFRWCSHEISRIEGLSDAVFAFAVTLLVVSLEVPRTRKGNRAASAIVYWLNSTVGPEGWFDLQVDLESAQINV